MKKMLKRLWTGATSVPTPPTGYDRRQSGDRLRECLTRVAEDIRNLDVSGLTVIVVRSSRDIKLISALLTDDPSAVEVLQGNCFELTHNRHLLDQWLANPFKTRLRYLISTASTLSTGWLVNTDEQVRVYSTVILTSQMATQLEGRAASANRVRKQMAATYLPTFEQEARTRRE